MNHVTIGVYNNQTFKVNIVKPEHLEHHIQYNKEWRWGRALFVDGNCVYEGYLNSDMVRHWTNEISKMRFDTSVSTEPYV